jgi:hypothetical protein
MKEKVLQYGLFLRIQIVYSPTKTSVNPDITLREPAPRGCDKSGTKWEQNKDLHEGRRRAMTDIRGRVSK